ncbi:MAG: TRAP transporter substrate-binding protein [Gammaproteobacteria bacterium]
MKKTIRTILQTRRIRNIVLYSLACAMPFCAARAAEKWDMPMAYSASNYHSEIGVEFAAEATRDSGGALEIVAHPGGSLFGGAEIYGAVRRGAAPIGERLISALGNEDPLFGLDSVPFLATSFADARRLYAASRPDLEKKLDESGLVLLYSVPWPPQGFYSVRPARSKDDLRGLKFRAYNAITSRLAELMGMSPTKIEAAELQQAFATGAAESMVSSGSTGYDRKLWEHVNYYYDVRAWLPRNMVFANKEAWENLDDSARAAVREAATRAEEKGWAKAEELAGWYVEQFRAKGMEVGDAPAQLQNDFAEAGAQLRAEWLEESGEQGRAILARYRAAE